MNYTFLSIYSSSSTATVIYYIRKIIFELLFFPKLKKLEGVEILTVQYGTFIKVLLKFC